MTTYSKLNFVYRLQKWMDSVPGQTFLNYAYSWGASIVILGTLFKLTHLPGANFFLFLGMGTVALPAAVPLSSTEVEELSAVSSEMATKQPAGKASPLRAVPSVSAVVAESSAAVVSWHSSPKYSPWARS